MGSIQWKHLNLCHTLFPREPKLFHINYLIDLQSPCIRFRIIISFSSWHPVCRRAINIMFWCLWCGPEDSCQWNSCCSFNLWEKPWSREMNRSLFQQTVPGMFLRPTHLQLLLAWGTTFCALGACFLLPSPSPTITHWTGKGSHPQSSQSTGWPKPMSVPGMTWWSGPMPASSGGGFLHQTQGDREE